jgi:hypothetical protein
VVGARLSSDGQARRLRAAHQFDPARRGDVTDVQPDPRQSRQFDVPRHHDIFGGVRNAAQTEAGGDRSLVHHPGAGERLVLAVQRDPPTEHPRVLHCAPHQLRVLQREGVVREEWAARFREATQFRQSLPLIRL